MRARLFAMWLAVACAAPNVGAQVPRGRGSPAAPTDTAALSPFARAKAEALLRDRLPCRGCHRIGADGGTIGPDLSTVTSRRTRDEIERMIRDPQGMVPAAAMPRVAMPDDWVRLIADYLGGPGSPAGVTRAGAIRPTPKTAMPRPPRPKPLGLPPAELYARFCAACHGAQGGGDGPNAVHLPVPPARHADSVTMATRPDDSLYDAIAGGGWIMGKSPTMPPFGATLAPDDIRGLVKHIRELCRCTGPAWSRDGKTGAEP